MIFPSNAGAGILSFPGGGFPAAGSTVLSSVGVELLSSAVGVEGLGGESHLL